MKPTNQLIAIFVTIIKKKKGDGGIKNQEL